MAVWNFTSFTSFTNFTSFVGLQLFTQSVLAGQLCSACKYLDLTDDYLGGRICKKSLMSKVIFITKLYYISLSSVFESRHNSPGTKTMISTSFSLSILFLGTQLGSYQMSPLMEVELNLLVSSVANHIGYRQQGICHSDLELFIYGSYAFSSL